MAIQYLSGGILNRTNSSEQGSGALLDLPYDMSWIAGYDSSWVSEDITVRTYGESIMPRSGEFIGEVGFVATGSTGAIIIVDVFKNGTTIYATTKPQFPTGTAWMTACIVDILKNGGSIYSTKPQFAISSNILTAGVIGPNPPTLFQPYDRITFKVTQVGSTVAGKGLRFNLKSRV